MRTRSFSCLHFFAAKITGGLATPVSLWNPRNSGAVRPGCQRPATVPVADLKQRADTNRDGRWDTRRRDALRHYTGPFTNLPAATSPYTNHLTAPQQFFQLKGD